MPATSAVIYTALHFLTNPSVVFATSSWWVAAADTTPARPPAQNVKDLITWGMQAKCLHHCCTVLILAKSVITEFVYYIRILNATFLISSEGATLSGSSSISSSPAQTSACWSPSVCNILDTEGLRVFMQVGSASLSGGQQKETQFRPEKRGVERARDKEWRRKR